MSQLLHDLAALVQATQNLRNLIGPMRLSRVLHAVTGALLT